MSCKILHPTLLLVTLCYLCSAGQAAEQETRTSLGERSLAVAATKAGPAGSCNSGSGLGATLLVPYFEVDLQAAGGINTLISVNNGLSSPVLARMVLWTDWGVPTLAFDIYLDGFDVQTMSFRDLFNGFIPSTGAGANLGSFAFCGQDYNPPFHTNPALSATDIAQLVASHTGVAGPLDVDCAAEPYGDQRVRGYATIDVVDECSGLESHRPIWTPANIAHPYFSDGGVGKGIATVDNALWGDVAYVENDNAYAQGAELVSIWADPDQFSGTGIRTFYGRYSGWDGRDDRVPLPWRWNQRFFNGGPFAGGGFLTVWRDTGSPSISPVPCGAVPHWWPLATTIGAVDEDAGGFTDLSGSGALHLATQKYDVSRFQLPYPFGWIQVDTPQAQSWVQTTLSAAGMYSATFNGIPVEFLCGPVR